MKKTTLYFFIFLSVLFSSHLKSQIAAPELRCVSVTSPTSALLSWVIPPDPSGLFTQYQIWSSPTQTGVFTLVGSVNTYTQTTFVHSPSNVGLQSQYYYVTTISSGTIVSLPSDTLRSIYVNVSGGNLDGVSNLNWNSLRIPMLPSSSTYTLFREESAGVWSAIYSGNALNYKDTIYKCKIFYNYKVEISDSYGCVSQSNVKGDTCKNIQPPYSLELDSVSVNANGKSVLGWQSSLSLDIACYVIYSSNGGFLNEIGRVCGGNNTAFTFTASLAGSASEGFCIAAVDSCGNYNIPSLTHNSIFLTAPSYDLCSRTASLSWTPYAKLFKGVLKYDIYCSINGADYTVIGSTSNTSFSHSSLTPGDVYCYFVRVRNTDLSISASSNSSCFTATGLPGPAFAYINSVSVNTSSKQVEISFTIDNANPYNGCNIYKSLDGIHFSKIAFVPSSTLTPQLYTDKDVKTSDKNYYYKIQVADDCDNPGVISNVSKTIVLKVRNDNENIFYNTLTWDDYTTWLGGVESFNIYRAVNGVFDPTPITNVPLGTDTYIDNVQDFVSAQGKFSYYIEAVEGAGNIYGFKDAAKSNPADAYAEVSVFVPNAFAPKGLNNVWLPVAQYIEKTDYKVMVFNRYGDKIFETHSDTEGWTGDAATDDVYVYLIEYKNSRGEYIQLKGHLNIVR